MSFDIDGLMAQKLAPRTETIEAPELLPWSKDEKPPEFLVRGLAGEEYYRAKEVIGRRKNVDDLVDAVVGENGKKASAALKEILGFGADLPDGYVFMIELVLAGTVQPKLDRQTAVRIAVSFPMLLKRLADTIYTLTGLGHEPGKQPGSGETSASATP